MRLKPTREGLPTCPDLLLQCGMATVLREPPHLHAWFVSPHWLGHQGPSNGARPSCVMPRSGYPAMNAATCSSVHLVGDSQHQDSANGTQTSTKRSRRGTAVTNTVTLHERRGPSALVAQDVSNLVWVLWTFIVACSLVPVPRLKARSSVLKPGTHRTGHGAAQC